MNIREELCTILSYRRSHNSEGEKLFLTEYLYPKLTSLGVNYETDKFGNVWVMQNSNILYAAHIDTCHSGSPEVRQAVSIEGDIVRSATEECLGADDAVGIVAMLWLLHNKVRVDCVFTRGEEMGGLGAKWIANNLESRLEKYTHCIEVDRMGTDEIIMEQCVGPTASIDFSQQVADMLNMGHHISDLGVYTDNAEFTVIPERINVSAGYYNQHTSNELVDLNYVEDLCNALLELDYGTFVVGDIDYSYELWDYESEPSDKFAPFFTEDEAFEYVAQNMEEVATYLYTRCVCPHDIEKS